MRVPPFSRGSRRGQQNCRQRSLDSSSPPAGVSQRMASSQTQTPNARDVNQLRRCDLRCRPLLEQREKGGTPVCFSVQNRSKPQVIISSGDRGHPSDFGPHGKSGRARGKSQNLRCQRFVCPHLEQRQMWGIPICLVVNKIAHQPLL